ncbi:MAG: hypothetical protein ABJE95_01415 [Byssovorax sp.]
MARPKKQESTPSTTSASAPSPPNAAADAFAKIEPELAALTPEELTPITVDVSAAVTAVLAAAPKIRELRDAIVEQLPLHPIAQLDELETYAHGAWYAHLLHTYANGSPEAAKAMIDEAQKLREDLLIAAEALAHRGMLDADAVAGIRKGHGHADTAGDLTALSQLFAASWSKVSSKTAVEKTEIDRAAELGPAVMVAIAVRKSGAKSTDTDGQRTRAFALLARAYDTCRRAVSYLRWMEADTDSIAPSLFKKRAGRKPGAGKKEEEAADAAPGATEAS